jgi:hypothetical protein
MGSETLWIYVGNWVTCTHLSNKFAKFPIPCRSLSAECCNYLSHFLNTDPSTILYSVNYVTINYAKSAGILTDNTFNNFFRIYFKRTTWNRVPQFKTVFNFGDIWWRVFKEHFLNMYVVKTIIGNFANLFERCVKVNQFPTYIYSLSGPMLSRIPVKIKENKIVRENSLT